MGMVFASASVVLMVVPYSELAAQVIFRRTPVAFSMASSTGLPSTMNSSVV